MRDHFSLTSSALPADARVLAFRGAEAISTLYRFEIYVLIDDPAFDMAAALGADTTLSVNREDGQPYLFHGILASLETVDDLAQRPPLPRGARPAPVAADLGPPQPRLRRRERAGHPPDGAARRAAWRWTTRGSS